MDRIVTVCRWSKCNKRRRQTPAFHCFNLSSLYHESVHGVDGQIGHFGLDNDSLGYDTSLHDSPGHDTSLCMTFRPEYLTA